LLRTQRRWKAVEHKIGDTVVRDFVPTKPNAATLVANNPFLPDESTPAIPSQGKLDFNAMHMWNLRMNAERDRAKVVRNRRWRRWRPGMGFRPIR